MDKLEQSEKQKNKWKNRVSSEIKLAMNVQKRLMPNRDLSNYPIYGLNIPAREISGDFYDFYLHDGMVRGDTLWGAAVYEGNFFAIDVSSAQNPQIFNDSLAFHETPNQFTPIFFDKYFGSYFRLNFYKFYIFHNIQCIHV